MNRKALIVDDSRMMRGMLGLTLREAKFDVTEANDGVEALDTIKDKQFDLIITDINMPNMGGIELVEKLRRDSRCRATPILILSTESSDDLKSQGRKAGANGWIVKPFVPKGLIRIVNKVCF